MQKTKSILLLLVFVSVLSFAMIPQTTATLPNGNGIQKINEHIHLTEPPVYYGRGYYYHPFDPVACSGKIKVGTWLTIGFGWADVVPEEDLEQEIAMAITIIESFSLSLTFDGEEIDIADCWRFDDVFIEDLEDGFYYFYIPFRYYIPPRAVGHYEIVFEWFPVGVWAGYIEWVPPNLLE